MHIFGTPFPRNTYGWQLLWFRYFQGIIPLYFSAFLIVVPNWHLLVQSNNCNTRTTFEICSKLTIKAPEWCRPGVFVNNFKHISHIVLLSPLLKWVVPLFSLFVCNNKVIVDASSNPPLCLRECTVLDLALKQQLNALMPGGKKKVTHT